MIFLYHSSRFSIFSITWTTRSAFLFRISPNTKKMKSFHLTLTELIDVYKWILSRTKQPATGNLHWNHRGSGLFRIKIAARSDYCERGAFFTTNVPRPYSAIEKRRVATRHVCGAWEIRGERTGILSDNDRNLGR